jgi:hypothetical protein
MLNPDLVAFIDQFIDSVETVDVVALLANSPLHSFSVEFVAHTLRTSVRSAGTRLERLRTACLLQRTESGYRFEPQDAELVARTKELLDAYATYRPRVIEAIFREQP